MSKTAKKKVIKAKAIPDLVEPIRAIPKKDVMEVVDAKVIKEVAEKVFEAVLVYRIDPSEYSTEWEAQKFKSVQEAVAFLSTIRVEKWFIVSGSQLKVTCS